MSPSLFAFLDAKPLYYDVIDLERMPKTFESVKSHFPTPKVIHVVGTNGKGTTGRFLAHALLQNGLNVGHYTSPHIINFNERIWLNGENVQDEQLEAVHQKLYKILTPEQRNALSYFEYTTLLAMLVYEGCDYVVLEAGLGGEFDATNVFEKTVSLFTPIDIDHQSFLGDTLEEIAATKFRSMQKRAILGFQHHKEVECIFESIGEACGCKSYKLEEILDASLRQEIQHIATEKKLAPYLQENLLLALSALDILGFDADVSELCERPLFGRLTPLRHNVLLDVGHNVLAAKAIAETLKNQKYVLIYNSYRDKDYRQIIKTLKPIIKHIELIAVDDVRAEQEDALIKVIEQEEIVVKKFATIEAEQSYLVFGSFSVAEAFLKYLEDI